MSDASPDLTAAELALGLLDGEDRAAALRRLLRDPVFATEVAWWRDRLAPLAEGAPAVAPDLNLFARVEASLDGGSRARPRAWPIVAALTAMAAALVLVALILRPAPAPVASPGPMLAAALAPVGSGEPIGAVYDARAGVLRLTAAPASPTGRSAELWLIAGKRAPLPLGLLRPGAPTRLAVPPGWRRDVADAAVLAVSSEPAGGAPDGRPSGPIVAKGALSPA